MASKQEKYTILMGSIKDPKTGKVSEPGDTVSLPAEDGDRLVSLGWLAKGEGVTVKTGANTSPEDAKLEAQIAALKAERDAAVKARAEAEKALADMTAERDAAVKARAEVDGVEGSKPTSQKTPPPSDKSGSDGLPLDKGGK